MFNSYWFSKSEIVCATVAELLIKISIINFFRKLVLECLTLNITKMQITVVLNCRFGHVEIAVQEKGHTIVHLKSFPFGSGEQMQT
jgi:hypothetical protein